MAPQLEAFRKDLWQSLKSGWGRLWVVFTVIWVASICFSGFYASSLLVISNLHHQDRYYDSIPANFIVRCTADDSKSECEKNVKRKIPQLNSHVVLMRAGTDALDEALVSRLYGDALAKALAEKKERVTATFLWAGGIIPLLVFFLGYGVRWVIRGFRSEKKNALIDLE